VNDRRIAIVLSIPLLLALAACSGERPLNRQLVTPDRASAID
jgi:hypothetical protein